MEKELFIIFSDTTNAPISDPIEIASILHDRENEQLTKNKNSPNIIFKDINARKLNVTPIFYNLGDCPALEEVQRINRKKHICNKEFLNPIPDLKIDISPDGKGSTHYDYKVNLNEKDFRIRVLFDELKDPALAELVDSKQPEKLEPLVREEFIRLIFETKRWKREKFKTEVKWIPVR